LTGRACESSPGTAEPIMTPDDSQQRLDKLGERIAIAILAVIAAVFLYAYIPHFLFG
jgi:hypothetical protein